MRLSSLLVPALLSATCAAGVEQSLPQDLMEIMELAVSDPSKLAEMISESPLAAIVDIPAGAAPEPVAVNSTLPFVFAHGMGDSCFRRGMKQITERTAAHAGAYGVCIPTGNNLITDTINGFLMNMDKSVDVFASKIRADPKLAGGFNAVGFSQGNSLIRGYIQKYNDPPVNVALHVHGTVSGVAGFPQCNPKNAICRALASVLGDLAYNKLVQGVLFQADYFRDPKKVSSRGYKKNSQLGAWNNEGDATNTSFGTNFGRVNRYVMVKAEKDTMVFPNEGEWWGAFADGTDKSVLPMNQTAWYKNDMFGLRTADQKGKIFFESTTGNHLQFTEEELFGWVDKYIVNKADEDAKRGLAATWTCTVCNHVYDPAKDGGGVPFEQLPDTWKCPVCGSPKSAYKQSTDGLWYHEHTVDETKDETVERARAATWTCTVCNHVYNPAKDGGGVPFEQLPDTWKCPVCGSPKSAYKQSADGLWYHEHTVDETKDETVERARAVTWTCTVCNHVYDPAKDGGGVPFEQLPDTWKCPVCGSPKSAYKQSADGLWYHEHA